jgi:hypothetical protein
MEGEMNQIIGQKIADARTAPVPAHTRPGVHFSGNKGKAMAFLTSRRPGLS